MNYGTCTTYSATATYALNALVIYNNRLYKCTTAITVAEAWNAAHWTAIADTNNGTVYNTTDLSFYGIRGADSVAKKLGSGDVIFSNSSAGSTGNAGVWCYSNIQYTMQKTCKVKVLLNGYGGQYKRFYKNGVLQTTPTENQFFEMALVSGDILSYQGASVSGSWYSFTYMYMLIIES